MKFFVDRHYTTEFCVVRMIFVSVKGNFLIHV